ncbi:OLC1v1032303C1 [Oldenlandia corymbosa var. corymbosa]|uniref:OLC1v1032303C1 n=1 Tax=Oldenlandia corymbosa var. corymbosa TaxID=529605 RepID=A0AAV1CLG8_OLDCO|nr:OLC1v1032303C1 [Oldenlandia corymbosa var. corymbosa]
MISALILSQMNSFDTDDIPELSKLKHFTLLASAASDHSLLPFTSLIRASPNLEKFTLKLNWPFISGREHRNTSKKGESFPLQHLKIVEICGRRTEVELVEFFLQNAVALERIVDQPFPGCLPRIGEEKTSRKLAKEQLVGIVPSHVELVII